MTKSYTDKKVQSIIEGRYQTKKLIAKVSSKCSLEHAKKGSKK